MRLARVTRAQAEARTVADKVDDLIGKVRHIDDRFAAAGCGEALEMPGDERLAASLDQGLGKPVSQWTQALAASGAEQHGLHSATSSRSRASGASSR